MQHLKNILMKNLWKICSALFYKNLKILYAFYKCSHLTKSLKDKSTYFKEFKKYCLEFLNI